MGGRDSPFEGANLMSASPHLWDEACLLTKNGMFRELFVSDTSTHGGPLSFGVASSPMFTAIVVSNLLVSQTIYMYIVLH